MNITTLLHNVANAIHDDSSTQAWCTTVYERGHKVFIGIDRRKPPAESDYPLVHVFQVRKSEGYELESQEHVLGVTCGIYDDDSRTVIRDRLTELESIEYIETFRKYVETAVVGAELSTMRIDELLIEYEVIDFFPFLLAHMEFTFVHDYSSGDDVFA